MSTDDPDPGRPPRVATVAETAQAPLRVVVTDGRGCLRPRPALARWIAQAAPAAARGEMVVALVSDAKMRALNREFRGVNRVTDVLSFPSGSTPITRAGTRRLLGDVVIANGVATRQARHAGHPVAVELRRLALHGLLHLLGYDHTRDTGRMKRFERRLWRQAGMVGEAS